jgi:hypothetical protein
MKYYQIHWGNCTKNFNNLKPGDLLKVYNKEILLFLKQENGWFVFLSKNNIITKQNLVQGIYEVVL